jgi:hypothetical protein
MKVSIRTAYRIIKHFGEDPESDPIYIPQYQEEGSEDWHTFDNHIGSGGYNTVYFYTFLKARRYVDHQRATQDVIIHYEDENGEWVEDLR